MRVDVLMILSNVAVALLMDALTASRILGILTDVDVDVLVDVDVNVFAGVNTASEFAMPDS